MAPDSTAGIAVCVLGSSSAGNSTLVWSTTSAVLVDCGFNPGYMEKSLRAKGLTIEDLDGVLITHVHGDHVNGWFVRKLIKAGVPIYCPPAIQLHLQVHYDALARASHLGLLRPLPDGQVNLAGFEVQAFAVPHDSPGGCFGYGIRFWEGGRSTKVTVTTDIANPTDSAARCMADADIMVIESNHDVDMLENSRRPLWLKRRIREFGHLSNDQCAGMLLSVLGNSTKLPRAVMLAHVSQECNTNQLALETTNEALDGEGIRGINVAATYPHRAGEVVCV